MEIFELPKPVRLEKPYQATHRFIGGPLDGQEHTGMVYFDLTNVVMTIDNAQYRYAGNDVFEYAGETSRMEVTPPTFLQRLKMRFLKFLFS